MLGRYTPVSKAVSRLEAGMWGGITSAQPVAGIKKSYPDLSVGYGPWRASAAKQVGDAAIAGRLPIYVLCDENQPDFNAVEMGERLAGPRACALRVSKTVLSRMIPARGGLPDHAIRPQPALVANEPEARKLFRALVSGILAVIATEFEAWYRSEYEKKAWPSQRTAIKPRRGRPSKKTYRLRLEILQQVESGNWAAEAGLPALSRYLRQLSLESIPSDDTLTRLVDALYRETGNPRLRRRRHRKKSQKANAAPPASPR